MNSYKKELYNCDHSNNHSIKHMLLIYQLF